MTDTEARSVIVRMSESGALDGRLLRPQDARWLLVLAHGAGAGMEHPFMEHLAQHLALVGVATLRYQFPYMQHRQRRPDPPAVLIAAVRAAISTAADMAAGLPLLAGGKSLGGRMTSRELSEPSTENREKARVQGLVCFGFPLHRAGDPSTERAKHLAQLTLPMLFLQGTRDALADLTLMKDLCRQLSPWATLRVLESADHAFRVPKRSGTTDDAVLRELARGVAAWADALPRLTLPRPGSRSPGHQL